jgi:hypothetical protein
VSTAAAVDLPAAETRLLRTLRGQPLDSLSTDGWAVYLRSGARTLAFVPEERDGPDDILLPDADVVRLRVEDRHALALPDPATELCAGLGVIRRLARMTTAVAFRLPVVAAPGPETEGAPGSELSPLHFHPDDVESGPPGAAEATVHSLVDVGVARPTRAGRSSRPTAGGSACWPRSRAASRRPWRP